ncbi:MAG: DNA-3-methyladenine glycosylase I [Sneathiellales bacterium]|nr:DNA-3-methyladenine glycosylase I [Sneathiellales bacterium]
MALTPIQDLFEIASERKGGADVFKETLPVPDTVDQLLEIPDDRWLSCMSKCVFNAGFNWRVVDKKWPDFEKIFSGFDIHKQAMMSDEDLDRYLQDARLIRHAKKITSIAENARFCVELKKEHGSVANAIGRWDPEDYIGLLDMIKKRGSRLGGATGQYFLRFMGVESFVLSQDVVKALIRDGVVEKNPTSKRDLKAVQEAFNEWREQGPYSHSEISRILACSVE